MICKKLSIFLVLILSLFIFSGCSEEIDCSSQDTDYLKYKLDEETQTCIISKEIPKNKCGNGVAEDGEAYCNCPDDVLKDDSKFGCEGTKGDYLEKSCDEFTKSCVLTQNDKVVEETKSLEFKNSDLVFNAKAVYNSPFILNIAKENTVKFDISLLKFASIAKKYKNIFVKELRVEDSKSNILASIDYNEQITSVGDKLSIKEIGFADTKEYELKNSLKLRLVVSYDVEYYDKEGYLLRTEPKIETLSASLSKFWILNPNFYEDE